MPRRQREPGADLFGRAGVEEDGAAPAERQPRTVRAVAHVGDRRREPHAPRPRRVRVSANAQRPVVVAERDPAPVRAPARATSTDRRPRAARRSPPGGRAVRRAGCPASARCPPAPALARQQQRPAGFHVDERRPYRGAARRPPGLSRAWPRSPRAIRPPPRRRPAAPRPPQARPQAALRALARGPALATYARSSALRSVSWASPTRPRRPGGRRGRAHRRRGRPRPIRARPRGSRRCTGGLRRPPRASPAVAAIRAAAPRARPPRSRR